MVFALLRYGDAEDSNGLHGHDMFGGALTFCKAHFSVSSPYTPKPSLTATKLPSWLEIGSDRFRPVHISQSKKNLAKCASQLTKGATEVCHGVRLGLVPVAKHPPPSIPPSYRRTLAANPLLSSLSTQTKHSGRMQLPMNSMEYREIFAAIAHNCR